MFYKLNWFQRQVVHSETVIKIKVFCFRNPTCSSLLRLDRFILRAVLNISIFFYCVSGSFHHHCTSTFIPHCVFLVMNEFQEICVLPVSVCKNFSLYIFLGRESSLFIRFSGRSMRQCKTTMHFPFMIFIHSEYFNTN